MQVGRGLGLGVHGKLVACLLPSVSAQHSLSEGPTLICCCMAGLVAPCAALLGDRCAPPAWPARSLPRRC